MTRTSIIHPCDIKKQLPASSQASLFIREARETSAAIIAGKDPRLGLVIGPCSIHDEKSALDYADRVMALAEKVKETCYLVMRVYIEKPRSSTGWKGFLYDPDLNGSYAIEQGLLRTRELLLKITEKKVPCATEFVDPLTALYFADLISWGFIGARTSASPPHRQLASYLEIPIGFKNSVDGNIDQAIYGTLSASGGHHFLSMGESGRIYYQSSKGNPHTHIVLRGSYDKSNYDKASLRRAAEQLKNQNLEARIMIDCSHGNAPTDPLDQSIAFQSVLSQIQEGNTAILGMMLESNMREGNQKLEKNPLLYIMVYLSQTPVSTGKPQKS